MTRVLLLHAGQVPHYRIGVYNHLSQFMAERAFALTVASDEIESGSQTEVAFDYVQRRLSAVAVTRLVRNGGFDVLIMFVPLREPYLFPVYFVVKGILRRKMVWWGQGRDLAAPNAKLKNAAYATEHALSDAIVLYAEHLKKYVARRFHHKVFVANNTMALGAPRPSSRTKEEVLKSYDIQTRKNVICMGRFQARKRIPDLLAAIQAMNRPDVGLILVGPDSDGVLQKVAAPNVHKLPPIYGEERFELLSAADVYCLPGAVGLSIVDAFHCGLPFVTDDGDESAEVAYLRHSENGLVVPRGDVQQLANSLQSLLDDDELRRRFSEAARREASTNANIQRLCEGFTEALRYATLPGPRASHR